MEKDKQIIIGCVLALIAIYFCTSGKSLIGEKDTRSLVLAISSERRPRVVYFYGKWCGACKRYGPVLKKAVDVYGKSIDFQEVDVDDPTSRLPREFHIHSIPATIIFDSYGHIVFGEGGCIDEISLNDILMNVYRSTVNQSSHPTVNKKTKVTAKHHKTQ